mmetsp:Transcript_98264/g.174957  ORF Transcript_98264/g.174957 Transcript_98264/m.174957 type:complete len:463 (+) Transcript_98264:22-1410(+)
MYGSLMSSCHDEISSQQIVKLPWLKWFVVFGQNPPALTVRQWQILFILIACDAFASYDGQIFSLSLVHIQRDLKMTDATLSSVNTFVTLAPLMGVPLVLSADIWGRRTMMLLTAIPCTVLTTLTALSPSYDYFALALFLARAFMFAEGVVAKVMITEEMPEHCRGWAIGVLAACASAGNGLALVLFGCLGDRPGGWRGLYALASANLLLFSTLRGRLPESKRFKSVTEKADSSLEGSVFHPLEKLMEQGIATLVGIVLLPLVLGISSAAAQLYMYKYLAEVHAFNASQISSLGIGGGICGLLMGSYAGSWSDCLGRRYIIAACSTACGFATAGLFRMPAGYSPALVCVLWTAQTAARFAYSPLVNVTISESCPTLCRSAAHALYQVGACGGTTLGILGESILTHNPIFPSHWSAISEMAVMQSLAAFVVLFAFKETAGCQLKEDAGDSSRKIDQPHNYASFP